MYVGGLWRVSNSTGGPEFGGLQFPALGGFSTIQIPGSLESKPLPHFNTLLAVACFNSLAFIPRAVPVWTLHISFATCATHVAPLFGVVNTPPTHITAFHSHSGHARAAVQKLRYVTTNGFPFNDFRDHHISTSTAHGRRRAPSNGHWRG